jgi:hypothetical protein
MTEIAVIAIVDAPAKRPSEFTWTDDSPEANRNYWYRVSAVDAGGNRSTPSQIVQARAYRSAPPLPPEIVSAVWVDTGGSSWVVRITWIMPEPGEVLVQRRTAPGAAWINIAAWLPEGQHTYDDSSALQDRAHEYRLKDRQGTMWQSVYSDSAAVGPRL